MSKRSTMTIRTDLAEKLKIIKEENYCASMNEVIESLLPYAVNENLKFKREPPAFTLIADENNKLDVGYHELRQAPTGGVWRIESDGYFEEATLLYGDGQGAFIRFCNSEDDVCDLLNKLYEENERLRNQLERLLNFLESFRYKSNIDGNYAKFNFIKPLGNDGIEIEIKRKTESYKHRSLDEYD